MGEAWEWVLGGMESRGTCSNADWKKHKASVDVLNPKS